MFRPVPSFLHWSGQSRVQIDTSFDFRTDASGPDPDSSSPTLKRYHRLLWSKALPSGRPFNLDGKLEHRSEIGDFFLSSDSFVRTFTTWQRMRHITDLLSEEENEAFRTLCYAIGGMIVFPRNRIDGKPTINQERGTNDNISDRADLTIECIRRFYSNETSPIINVIQRYGNFFELFETFSGYVDFFLLQDLVSLDYLKVRFFTDFDDFKTPSTPKDIHTYRDYRQNSIEFVEARNRRIDRYAAHAP